MRQVAKAGTGTVPRRRRTDGSAESWAANVRPDAAWPGEADERAAFRAASVESRGDLRESFLAGMPVGWTPDL